MSEGDEFVNRLRNAFQGFEAAKTAMQQFEEKHYADVKKCFHSLEEHNLELQQQLLTKDSEISGLKQHVTQLQVEIQRMKDEPELVRLRNIVDTIRYTMTGLPDPTLNMPSVSAPQPPVNGQPPSTPLLSSLTNGQSASAPVPHNENVKAIEAERPSEDEGNKTPQANPITSRLTKRKRVDDSPHDAKLQRTRTGGEGAFTSSPRDPRSSTAPPHPPSSSSSSLTDLFSEADDRGQEASSSSVQPVRLTKGPLNQTTTVSRAWSSPADHNPFPRDVVQREYDTDTDRRTNGKDTHEHERVEGDEEGEDESDSDDGDDDDYVEGQGENRSKNHGAPHSSRDGISPQRRITSGDPKTGLNPDPIPSELWLGQEGDPPEVISAVRTAAGRKPILDDENYKGSIRLVHCKRCGLNRRWYRPCRVENVPGEQRCGHCRNGHQRCSFLPPMPVIPRKRKVKGEKVESEGMDMDEAEAIVNPPSDDSVAMSESSRQSGQPRRKSVLDGPYWQSLP
jgi:hypothetical protein